MTDNFKNLVIETEKDESGKVTKVIMPVTGTEINIVYDANGGIADIQNAEGNTFDMSTAVGAVSVDYSLYTETEDDPLDDGFATDKVISVADKILSMNGKIINLEFTEDGRLWKESNEKFTAHYFLKETVNYGPLCTNRLAIVYGNMLAAVREIKLADGTIAHEEVLFGNVLTRTAV